MVWIRAWWLDDANSVGRVLCDLPLRLQLFDRHCMHVVDSFVHSTHCARSKFILKSQII